MSMCRLDIIDVVDSNLVYYNGEYELVDELAKELKTKYDLWYYL